jgi:hypothetical protein
MVNKRNNKRQGSLATRVFEDWRVWSIILIIGIILVGYFGVVGLGSFFQPSAPPEERATGYARLSLIDLYSGEYINTDGIHLIRTSNLTAWETNMTTGTIFYVPESSIWWTNVSGYYPASDTLYASGEDPNDYDNFMIISKRANLSHVNVEITQWKNATGSYNYSGILPDYDGVFEFEISIFIDLPSKNTSAFGVNSFIPNYTLAEDTFAYNMSLNFVTLWLGWNATVHDFTVDSHDDWNYTDVYDINILNCTMIPQCYDTQTYTIVGNFSNINDLRVYDLTIDNYVNPVAIIY